MNAFLLERYRYVLEQRGFDVRNVRAVLQETRFAQLSPADALKRLEVLPEFTVSPIFRSWPSRSSASRTSRANCRTSRHGRRRIEPPLATAAQGTGRNRAAARTRAARPRN